MRKKLNIIAAVVLAMTLMFGSTLCYAAEADGIAELSEKSSAIARPQSGAEQKNIQGDNGANFDIILDYQWDEGYAGWFTDVALTGIHNANVLSFSHTAVNNSYVTVTIRYKDNTNTEKEVSATYHVDEYGDIS